MFFMNEKQLIIYLIASKRKFIFTAKNGKKSIESIADYEEACEDYGSNEAQNVW